MATNKKTTAAQKEVVTKAESKFPEDQIFVGSKDKNASVYLGAIVKVIRKCGKAKVFIPLWNGAIGQNLIEMLNIPAADIKVVEDDRGMKLLFEISRVVLT